MSQNEILPHFFFFDAYGELTIGHKINYFNISILISMKKIRKMLRAGFIVFEKYRRFLSQLDDYITTSRIGKAKLAKMLAIPYKTFYRKVRNGKFNQDEIEKLINNVEKAKLELNQRKKNPKNTRKGEHSGNDHS